MRRAIAFLLLLALQASGATYYVRTDGNDANDGLSNTAGGAFLTIQRGENVATSAGDIVRVQAGTYNERVAANTDGTAGNYITYIADGTAVMRGFDLSGTDYIRIIGFEITHTASTWSRAISFSGNCSYVEILDNYIHNTYNEGGAIRAIGATSTNNYVTIRGNRFYYLGFVSGVFELGNSMAVQTEFWNQYWLVEYNIVQRAGDFIDMDSHNSIVRNNWIHDYLDSYWPGGGGGHSDIFQPFSVSNQVYEANMAGDNAELNSHYLQLRQNDAIGTNILFRGNVAYNFGSYALQCSGPGRVRLYNNTFYDICNIADDTPFAFQDEVGFGSSVEGLLINNIVHTSQDSAGDLYVSIEAGFSVSVEVGTNLAYLVGTGNGGITVNSDPLFVDISEKKFHLQSSSPARNAGRYLVKVAQADGSGTTFAVTHAKDLIDGWGIVQADWVVVDGNSAVQISSISGSNITVSSSVTWTNGAGVHWGLDATPDIGAYPYGHTPLTSATYTTGGTVTPDGDTRFVKQYRNGIEVATDYSAPYSFSHTEGDTYRAFPLFAATNVMVTATAYDPPPPAGEGPPGVRQSPLQLPQFR